jgi:hypothetical protein
VEDVVRLYEYSANILISEEEKHFGIHGEITDSGFLNIFSLPPILEENPDNSLNAPNSILLKQLATKF